MPDSALIDQYQTLLLQLLPPGIAMSRRPDSNVAAWARALAVEFAREHEAADNAYANQYPGTATDMLDEWLELQGLPDGCTGPLTTNAEKQAALLQRLVVQKTQSEPDLLSLATDEGFSAEISIYPVWRTGVVGVGTMPLWSVQHYYALAINTWPTSEGEHLELFNWNDSITVGAAGDVAFNNVNEENASIVRIGVLNSDGTNVETELAALDSGDWLRVYDQRGESLTFDVSGAGTDQGSWYDIPVVSGTATDGWQTPPSAVSLFGSHRVRVFLYDAAISKPDVARVECIFRRHIHASIATPINSTGSPYFGSHPR